MKISIIIPCYNPGPFLHQCLESALQQDYHNYEVIFVDNESTDGSLEMAEGFKNKYPNLIISTAPNKFKYSWEEPVGEGMKLMTGDYFTMLGADDFITPNYLSNVSKHLDARAIQSRIRRLYPDNRVDEVGHKYSNLKEFKEQLFKHCSVNTPSVFYKRSLYEEGLMSWNSKDYLGACDYDLYFQFADKDIFIKPVDSWLGYWYRWHKDQSTWGMVEEIRSGNNLDQKIKNYWSVKWKTI